MKILLPLIILFSFAAAQAAEPTFTPRQERFLLCIADRLQAYNSDIFLYMTPAEVNYLLVTPDAYGHDEAVRASRYCKFVR